MRNITFKRCASSFEFLKKITVYVEDPTGGSENIGGVVCTRACILKNGDEASFSVTEEPVRIFAVIDGAEKELCTKGYQLEEGSESLVLSGECRDSLPESGYFHFFEAKKYKKKIRVNTKLIAIISVLLIIGVICAGVVIAISPKPMKFSVEEMTITLTEDFRTYEEEGFIETFRSSNIWIGAYREAYDLSPAARNLSEKEYAEFIKDKNGGVAEIKQTRRGIYYLVFDSEHPINNVHYFYYGFVYKSDEALWFIQFGTTEEYFNRYKNKFIKWANSVEFE